MKRGLIRKKNCFGCRAYWYDELRGHCQLYYGVKEVQRVGGGSVTVPQEVCPKPRTYSDLARAAVKSKGESNE